MSMYWWHVAPCYDRCVIKDHKSIWNDQEALCKNKQSKICLIWSLWHLTPLPSNAWLRALLSHRPLRIPPYKIISYLTSISIFSCSILPPPFLFDQNENYIKTPTRILGHDDCLAFPCISTACCNMSPQTCAASAAAASAWMHQSWKGFILPPIRHPSVNWMKNGSQRLHIVQVLCCASAGWDLDIDDTSVRGTDGTDGSDGTGTGGMTEVDRVVFGGSTDPDSAALASSA